MGKGARTERSPSRFLGAWLFVYALFGLCAVLGILQYRAIAEVSIAARERLRSSLEASLVAFSQDFNSEISSAAGALTPASPEDAEAAPPAFAALYARGRTTARYRQLFSRIAMAVPQKRGLGLLVFDAAEGAWKPAEWPAEWSGMRSRIESRQPGGQPPTPPVRDEGTVFEVPVFNNPPGGFGRRGPRFGRGPAGLPPSRHEVVWLIFEVNIPYVRESLLPELLQRHLGADYQAEVVTRSTPRAVIYRSDPDLASSLEQAADASASLFDPQGEGMFHRGGPPGGGSHGPGPGSGPGPGRGPSPGMGRWLMFVRHRAGSLEAVVSQARWRSMAVTAGVLLMLAATLAALIRYTRRAQKLAELQMEFVAGVSHELRTPLTVIHTAAHNLRGKVASNPAQVERYGALIQQESGRLKELVEQVLRFAGANAGHVIQEREPLAVERLLDEAIAASRPVTEAAGCVVEKRAEADLPAVAADPVALRQALQNLLANAAKYGSGESRWIGIAVSKTRGAGEPGVEIRVSDRGPGIPAEEQGRIFDPFFRGARAVEDQVHGTGLGLSLVKKIVEAHGGTIRVRSEPMKGAEFVVWLPALAAPAAGVAG
ncbi:MAG TPA: HAMP domain-containing sensor histidine kinase [Bryobacteraceae bacterium]|nr:HAMP domain-containing sensor histidine kinase [Bryobacteraceae bacterium]